MLIQPTSGTTVRPIISKLPVVFAHTKLAGIIPNVPSPKLLMANTLGNTLLVAHMVVVAILVRQHDNFHGVRRKLTVFDFSWFGTHVHKKRSTGR